MDKNRGKYSICSGTMQDSWAHDRGCGVLAAMREAHEEFKIEFQSPAEFLSVVTHSWWESNTLCFGVCLDKFADPADPRRDLGALNERVRAALSNPSLPMCEKEITSLTWFVVDDVCGGGSGSAADISKNKKATSAVTGFGTLCIEKLRRKIAASLTKASPSWRSAPPAVAEAKTDDEKISK